MHVGHLQLDACECGNRVQSLLAAQIERVLNTGRIRAIGELARKVVVQDPLHSISCTIIVDVLGSIVGPFGADDRAEDAIRGIGQGSIVVPEEVHER